MLTAVCWSSSGDKVERLRSFIFCITVINIHIGVFPGSLHRYTQVLYCETNDNFILIGPVTMNNHILFQDGITCHKRLCEKQRLCHKIKDEWRLFSSYVHEKQDTRGDNWSTYTSNTKPVATRRNSVVWILISITRSK